MGFLKDTFDNITGKSGERAARDAGKLGYEASENGVDLTSRMYDTNLGRLRPYADIGLDNLGAYQDTANRDWQTGVDNVAGTVRPGEGNPWVSGLINNARQAGSPYNGRSYSSSVDRSGLDAASDAANAAGGQWTRGLMDIANTHYKDLDGFKDASAAMSRNLMNNSAARGRLGSGQTLQDLFSNNAQLGMNMRNNQLNNAMGVGNFDMSRLQNNYSNRFNTGSLVETGRNNAANNSIASAQVGEAAKQNAFSRALNAANFAESTKMNDYNRMLGSETFAHNAGNSAFNRYGSLVNLGNNNALNQAKMGADAAANISNLWNGGASALAGGLIGANNSSVAGTGNLISLAAMGAGMYGGGGGTPIMSGGLPTSPSLNPADYD